MANGHVHLVVVDERGELQYELGNGTVTLGRAPDNSIQLTDAEVSKHHASLTVTDQGVELRDVGSTNGTFVNEWRVDRAVSIAPHDVVRLARSTTLRLVGAATGPSPAVAAGTGVAAGAGAVAVAPGRQKKRKKTRCQACGGTGRSRCPRCNGMRRVACTSCGGSGGRTNFAMGRPGGQRSMCTGCGGSGRTTCLSCAGFGGPVCPVCNGSGHRDQPG